MDSCRKRGFVKIRLQYPFYDVLQRIRLQKKGAINNVAWC